jgi:hypothetical protein
MDGTLLCIGEPEDLLPLTEERVVSPLLAGLQEQTDLVRIPYSQVANFHTAKEVFQSHHFGKVLFCDFWNPVLPVVAYYLGGPEVPLIGLYSYALPRFQWGERVVATNFANFAQYLYTITLTNLEVSFEKVNLIFFPLLPIDCPSRKEKEWVPRLVFAYPWEEIYGIAEFLDFVGYLNSIPMRQFLTITVKKIPGSVIPQELLESLQIEVLPEEIPLSEIFEEGGYIWGSTPESAYLLIDAVINGASPFVSRKASVFELFGEELRYGNFDDAVRRIASRLILTDRQWQEVCEKDHTIKNALIDYIIQM